MLTRVSWFGGCLLRLGVGWFICELFGGLRCFWVINFSLGLDGFVGLLLVIGVAGLAVCRRLCHSLLFMFDFMVWLCMICIL